jgi:hypothetical protein
MRIFTKLLTVSAALAAAAPAAAQYYSNPYSSSAYAQPYGYAQTYGYAQPYGYGQQYGYAQTYGISTAAAEQQCSAAVQSRLYNRSSSGIGGILGAVLGTSTSTTGRVVAITQASPRTDGTVRVRGLASSGRYAMNGYGAYGVGAYGAAGYGYASQADLSFRCDVGMNGQIYDVSIRRRY